MNSDQKFSNQKQESAIKPADHMVAGRAEGTGETKNGAVRIHQDAKLFASLLEQGLATQPARLASSRPRRRHSESPTTARRRWRRRKSGICSSDLRNQQRIRDPVVRSGVRPDQFACRGIACNLSLYLLERGQLPRGRLRSTKPRFGQVGDGLGLSRWPPRKCL